MKLSGLEKLDAHAKQSYAVSSVLAVIPKSCHQLLALGAHVCTVARGAHLIELGLRITYERLVSPSTAESVPVSYESLEGWILG